MQDKINNEHYVVEIICDSVHILLPLQNIRKIISSKDIQQSSNKDLVIYQEREYLANSFSKLLKRQSTKVEEYAILIENEDIEAIIYIEKVEGIKTVDNNFYDFPIYLKEQGIDYIINCYISETGNLAFQIDFIKLLKRFYNL